MVQDIVCTFYVSVSVSVLLRNQLNVLNAEDDKQKLSDSLRIFRFVLYFVLFFEFVVYETTAGRDVHFKFIESSPLGWSSWSPRSLLRKEKEKKKEESPDRRLKSPCPRLYFS